MKYSRYCRSLLSTPASEVDRYPKSHHSGADMCVVDLEDSVPHRDKENARRQAESFFTAPSATATRCGIRINSVTEPDGLRDLLALRHYTVKPDVVVIPKVESARDIEIVDRVLHGSCPTTRFFAVVETPRGLDNARLIAAASPRLRALVFGAADYSFDIGARLAWDPLLHARARLVNSARAAGIDVVDAPFFAFADTAGLKYEAALSRDLGFSGKIAVHPRQVPAINEAFSPDAELLEKARRVVAAGRASGEGIAVVDGVMVGTPFFEAARRLVEEFGTNESTALPSVSGSQQ
ncbi:HpcH/HpaI aldolase/citrate lyase family protein [Streptomyces albireticuli]|uniref:CoA ester lyase n=2 Tax=Streptomyces albireticuli TaxID=1940 RepID=A0A2A2DAJ5_9ACTN|nr:CoA ester lyase [Streptomyces albireticuli]MCD9194289.1 CoA ester lyase [Streptomyces albireticuli]PAU48501.1 CoA ester lyase [Streptomyces albireticuli]